MLGTHKFHYSLDPGLWECLDAMDAADDEFEVVEVDFTDDEGSEDLGEVDEW